MKLWWRHDDIQLTARRMERPAAEEGIAFALSGPLTGFRAFSVTPLAGS